MGLFGWGNGYDGPTLKSAGVRYMPGDSPGRATRAVIEGIDASGNKVHIQASDAALKAHSLDPRLTSQERIDIADSERKEFAGRKELQQDKAARLAREGKEKDRAYGLQVRAAELAESNANAANKHNEGVLGIQQQQANTQDYAVRADVGIKQGTLSLQERELLQRGSHFDQTHLLAQQQNAMNYNLTATRLNNDIEAQNYDRRLRTMEGIGAAIAGLAAMIGG